MVCHGGISKTPPSDAPRNVASSAAEPTPPRSRSYAAAESRSRATHAAWWTGGDGFAGFRENRCNTKVMQDGGQLYDRVYHIFHGT